jgi:F-type H+-transporting ATPase subunit b
VLIDWFTVIAQIVNFLVLVGLMKRFLYGPLIAAIDAREHSIASRIADAARKEQEAGARREHLTEEIAETERQKAGIIAAAREEADRERGEIVARARNDVKAQEARWRDELKREKGAFLDEVRRRAAAEILAATRCALHDLACADVQRCAMSAFLEKLRSIDSGAFRSFAAGGLTVVSREDLPPEMRCAVQKTLEELLGAPVETAFERAPAMAWGVELRGNGQRIGWTPDSYLDSLEDKLRAALDRAAAENYPVAV